MKIVSLLLFLSLSACTTVKKHTYLKYAGYVEGCIDGTENMLNHISYSPIEYFYTIEEDALSKVEAICLDKYMQKLDEANIEYPMERTKEHTIVTGDDDGPDVR